jgi:hypothetical protein
MVFEGNKYPQYAFMRRENKAVGTVLLDVTDILKTFEV